MGLDLVQLHGKSEGWEIAKKLRVPAVRVVHMAEDVSAAQVLGQLRGGSCVAVLLDSKGGGTGQTFDWKVANPKPSPSQVLSLGRIPTLTLTLTLSA